MRSFQVQQFGQPLTEALREPPQPQGTEVLLEVHACGACHSDVHLQDGSFAFGFGALRKAGKLVSVGLFGGSTPVSSALVAMKAVTVMGSYVGSLEEMHELMRIARAGTLPALPVTTRALDTVNDALADLKQGRVRGRVVLLP